MNSKLAYKVRNPVGSYGSIRNFSPKLLIRNRNGQIFSNNEIITRREKEKREKLNIKSILSFVERVSKWFRSLARGKFLPTDQ